jgi:hypothetical protein
MQKKKILAILVVLFFIGACASLTGTGTQTMTPKRQATIWLNIYNAQYDDTMSVMTNPNSTAAQKELGLKKKAILTKVWPLLKVYVAVVEGGGIPGDSDTAAITDLINQLTTLATP